MLEFAYIHHVEAGGALEECTCAIFGIRLVSRTLSYMDVGIRHLLFPEDY